MKMSEAFIVINYPKFNKQFFNNELPHINTIPVKAVNTNKVVARVIYNRYTKAIRFEYSQVVEFADRKYAEEVLIHEMIHIWQIHNDFSDMHGRSFKNKAYHIATQSPYQITTTIQQGKLAPNLVEVYAAIYKGQKETGGCRFKCFKKTPAKLNIILDQPLHSIYKIELNRNEIRFSNSLYSKTWLVSYDIVEYIRKNGRQLL